MNDNTNTNHQIHKILIIRQHELLTYFFIFFVYALAHIKNCRTFATLLRDKATRSKNNRALSSAGSERLPYKQRVGGSNPSAPTTESLTIAVVRLFLFWQWLEHRPLPQKLVYVKH